MDDRCTCHACLGLHCGAGRAQGRRRTQLQGEEACTTGSCRLLSLLVIRTGNKSPSCPSVLRPLGRAVAGCTTWQRGRPGKGQKCTMPKRAVRHWQALWQKQVDVRGCCAHGCRSWSHTASTLGATTCSHCGLLRGVVEREGRGSQATYGGRGWQVRVCQQRQDQFA